MKAPYFLLYILLLSPILANSQDTNRTDDNGMRQGLWQGKHDNGTRSYIGNFENNKPVGEFVYFDPFGTMSKRIIHKGDSTFATFYHVDGTIMGKGQYYKKQKAGVWRYYDEDSDISLLEPYVDNKVHGVCTTYYKTGEITRIQAFEKGIKNGMCEDYFKSGKLKFKGTFVDGNLDGYVVHYYPDGREWHRGKYRASVKDGKWLYFDEKGNLETTEIYEFGKRVDPEKSTQIAKPIQKTE